MYLPDNIEFIRGKKAAGIHLVITSDGNWIMNIVILKHSKNKIQIDSNISGLTHFDTITTLLPRSIPLCISLEGKGIIHRKVNISEDNDPVNQILPNAKRSDFIIQSQPAEAGLIMLSLTRSNCLNEILIFFRDKGYFVCKLFLGPFSLNNLWSQDTIKDAVCHVNGYKIEFQNNIITELEYTGKTYDVGESAISGDALPLDNLVAYSNALSFFAKQKTVSQFQLGSPPVLSYEDYIYKRSFTYIGIGLIATLFGALLLNFAFYSHYNEKLSQVTKQFSSGLEIIAHLEKLKKDLIIKENLIKENGLLQQSRISYFADRIGELLPEQIVLSRLEINPILTKPKTVQEIAFNKNTIRISGKCSYSMLLNDWMEVLKKEPWISHIEVLQYKQEEKKLPGEFTLFIDLQ